MATKVPVTIAQGDGIGPDITAAALEILEAAGAALAYEHIEIGENVYLAGHGSGIAPESWESIRRTKLLLKGPITTPQGGGVKSLNVTLRKTMALYANVRPCRAFDPFIRTKHPHIDVVIVRENEEDLYGGIEHRQTDEMVQCLKLISRPGSEKIIRYAFEYCRHRDRKRLTCFTKDNIMKLTDGLFHQVFREVSEEYPEIEANHMIIDIGMARVADRPEDFDVIVTPNLYGDILSDVAAEISGSVGMAGSANIGDHAALFEAIHGSAPDIAGQDIANPSGLIQASVKMLAHVGQGETAEIIHNALLKTVEDGIHTRDIYSHSRSTALVGTKEFTRAVIDRLGQLPEHLVAAHYTLGATPIAEYHPRPRAKKELVGVDVFFHWNGESGDPLAAQLQEAAPGDLELKMITNRGVKVWPEGFSETFCSDHWRCRFMTPISGGPVTHAAIVKLLGQLDAADMDFIKTEHLYTFDGEPGFSLGQGQ